MNWKRSLVGCAIAVSILALLVYGMRHDPRALPNVLTGRSAPGFALVTLESGDTVRLADLAGQVVVLNFWASWCFPCRQEHPQLLAAEQLYRGQGVRFLGLIYQDTRGNARAWLEELGATYPSLIDDGTRTAIEYGVTGPPETFVIDRQGTVRHKRLGPWMTLDELRAVLDPLVVEPAKTALGTEPLIRP
jgi:cytochrome c biogenesis protein CcmG/thiol:disulfide interchange protein DsbE